MESEIKLINNLILQSIMHGADIGGSYDCNEDGLIIAIQDWLEYKGLSDKYTAMVIEVPVCNSYWVVWQIVEK